MIAYDPTYETRRFINSAAFLPTDLSFAQRVILIWAQSLQIFTFQRRFVILRNESSGTARLQDLHLRIVIILPNVPYT